MDKQKEKILRLPAVMEQLSVSRATVYRMMDSGRLPKPIKLGLRSVGWLESDISQFIENQVNARV
ncbi:helix-turn-helix transcriptional regulator [Candidatus Thiodubiliella endoseptemdiera]|uniref:helix-turn-helix transcriptional regulator n=1 Tax=Candidatus Thiodubiliella endoseptemdiera TaxID=2738886 RepID=UPI0034DE0DF0